MSSEIVDYPGKDLESMHFAVRYHRWILDIFEPFLGNRFVEVGAGSGSFSELLLNKNPESISLVEPSEMFEPLRITVHKALISTKIDLYHNIFSNVADVIKESQQPDSIFYINVLEHIEDDVAELDKIHSTLEIGGRLFIFVPANQFLFSDFDKEIGHFRRYDRKQLTDKLLSAGFNIKLLRWFDLPGILPWLVKFKWLRSSDLDRGSVLAYDRFAVPIVRKLEHLVHPPIGKNLIVVAEKI